MRWSLNWALKVSRKPNLLRRDPRDTMMKQSPVTSSERLAQFEQLMLPHMAAAYNLARWLTHQEEDARDVTQEAMVRAFTFFKGYHGGDARAWLLAIVRNTCYTWLRRNRSHEFSASFDLDLHDTEAPEADPEQRALQSASQEPLRKTFRKRSPFDGPFPSIPPHLKFNPHQKRGDDES